MAVIIVDTGSDHNVMQVKWASLKRRKIQVDRRSRWDALQQAIEDFICMEMRIGDFVRCYCCTMWHGQFMTFKGLQVSQPRTQAVINEQPRYEAIGEQPMRSLR